MKKTKTVKINKPSFNTFMLTKQIVAGAMRTQCKTAPSTARRIPDNKTYISVCKNQMKLKGLPYNEFIDYITGQALMEIGQGKPFRDVVGTIWNATLMWRYENVVAPKPKNDNKRSN